MAATGEAQALADGLAQDRAARIENTRHDGRINVRHVPLKHAGAVHHGDAGDAHGVLYGHGLARQGPRRCAPDLRAPVPSAQGVIAWLRRYPGLRGYLTARVGSTSCSSRAYDAKTPAMSPWKDWRSSTV